MASYVPAKIIDASTNNNPEQIPVTFDPELIDKLKGSIYDGV